MQPLRFGHVIAIPDKDRYKHWPEVDPLRTLEGQFRARGLQFYTAPANDINDPGASCSFIATPDDPVSTFKRNSAILATAIELRKQTGNLSRIKTELEQNAQNEMDKFLRQAVHYKPWP